MKVTLYVRHEFIEHLAKLIHLNKTSTTGQEYLINNNILTIFNDCVTTENAKRTHFQGWIEVQVEYESYIKLKDDYGL
jgi:hypothetical protein